MTIRSNGSYIGPRPAGPSAAAASGIWDLRTAERQRRAVEWPGFQPTDISNLALWLDGSDSSTLFDATSGGSEVAVDGGVARWQDKSGNGRHFTQSTASSRPARKASQINGLDAVLYDGSDDIMTRAAESWAYTYPLTVFAVFRATSLSASYNSLWDFYSSAGGNDASSTGLIKSNGKSAVYTTATDGAQPSYDGNGSLTYSTATNYVFAAEIANNAIASRGNGAADGSFAGSFTLRTSIGASSIDIGASEKFSRFTAWAIGEILVYNSAALTTWQRDAVEGYLMTKWGAT